ncbi:MAG: adenosylcobinamide-phosphate synthase CbiB [Bacteroides sp.]|nr:adenosylcobinamide-phosphate synthase CbiB [Bacteroides sp.]
MIAFGMGFWLDLLLGDPHWMPHPVRMIGGLISGMERRLRRGSDRQGTGEERNRAELWRGGLLVAAVCAITTIVAACLLIGAYRIRPWVGAAVECVMTYQILAVKSLRMESMKVYRCLKIGDLPQARAAVSMIVGRDTEHLDEEGIAKAAIETVAENTSDGVIAPMLYLAIGGPILGWLYKAVNTMDSMVGYKNDRYLYFGRAAAKLDDLVNFLPARISAGLMIAVSFLGGRDFSGRDAWRIFRRDRGKHASPNSAQTEAACAGALGIRLAGDARYFGRTVSKPYIGDATRGVECEDIRRANRLMYGTAWLCEILCLAVLAALCL